jgi:hypothetical protein
VAQSKPRNRNAIPPHIEPDSRAAGKAYRVANAARRLQPRRLSRRASAHILATRHRVACVVTRDTILTADALAMVGAIVREGRRDISDDALNVNRAHATPEGQCPEIGAPCRHACDALDRFNCLIRAAERDNEDIDDKAWREAFDRETRADEAARDRLLPWRGTF